MSKSNPILPSEPLSLQPNVAKAVVNSQDSRQLSPRSASKVRRRMDIRNFGRSESPGRTSERDRYREQEHASYRPHEMREGDRAYERRDGRSHSPRNESFNAEYGRNNDRETHDEEHKSEPVPTRVLGIFGMSKYTSEQNLREIFERYGPIEKVNVIRDPHVRIY
ncbi:Transformer-2 protein alpha [Coemansia sp. RSA 1972]|nr:Transformer-2 protein alpha [Coemansia sp. RSA 1972]